MLLNSAIPHHIPLYLAVQLVIMVDKATLWLMKTIQSLMMNLATNCAKIGSFTPAAQSVNLRGLGASRTLILIDGRRLPQYPLAQDGTSNFQDIGQIPVAAIERVAILCCQSVGTS